MKCATQGISLSHRRNEVLAPSQRDWPGTEGPVIKGHAYSVRCPDGKSRHGVGGGHQGWGAAEGLLTGGHFGVAPTGATATF